jgi:uncharacterized protein (DUF305 family)
MSQAVNDQPRIERLISLAERIIAALESDIESLKQGRTAALATADPEIQKLTVIYGREAQGFDPRIAQSAPPTLRQRFFAVTAKFREVLQLHGRMIVRVKNASEGIVKAIAAEVERSNAPMKTYGPRPGYKPQSSGAMVFNRVV